MIDTPCVHGMVEQNNLTVGMVPYGGGMPMVRHLKVFSRTGAQ